MTTPTRIDWPRVIRDLEGFGLNCRAIGARVGRGRLWVVRLRNGVRPQPGFRDGCRMLRLWSDAMGKSFCEAPKKGVP